jgi:uncharacterized membrane protein YfcA
MEVSLSTGALVFGSAFLVGFSKTSAGGVGLLIIVLITAAFPGKESLGVLIPMLFFADIVAVITYRRHCKWGVIVKIFPITALGVVLGSLLVDYVPPALFLPTLGFIIVGLLALDLLIETRTLNMCSAKVFVIFTGLFVGVSSMMANAAGPLLSIYLLHLRLPKESFVGTRSWFFLLVNALKFPIAMRLGLINTETLKLDLLFFPVIIIGAIVGWFATRKISFAGFKWWIRGVSMIAGMKFIFF